MVRVLNHMLVGAGWGSMTLAIGLFLSISALLALCAKGARRTKLQEHKAGMPKSPLASPRRIMETVSNKVSNISFLKRNVERNEEGGGEGFGEGGLWQNTILMGEKCQPLEFSGAIFYDNYGNRLSEMPKSPRASPMSSTFSFPVTARESMA
ncbi:hypothetical protein QQ045_016691 [Rhodiola kirilowii]